MIETTKLRTLGVIPAVAKHLQPGREQVVADIYAMIIDEVSAFTDSGNPDVRPEMQQHLQQHVDEVCRLLGGAREANLDFVLEHAELRAAQKFPLDAVLAAYRCLHKSVANWTREAALQAADDTAHVRRVVAAVTEFTIEYTGAISTLITSEYVARTRSLAEAEGDRRTELFNMLLSGYDESDRRAAQLLRSGGYLEQRQSFCVAVARSVKPQEMQNQARAQRMADAISDAVRNLPIRTLVGIRDDLVVVVMSGTRRLSGWTAPQSLLADRVFPHLRTVGPAALIGVSADAPSTSHIPRALREATLALDLASVSERVMPYSRIPFRHMLISVARDNIQTALPTWLPAFRAADEKAKGRLIETLRAYADADMNVLRTAKNLAVHPNTIYSRVQRIQDITGRNALEYQHLTEMLLAHDCSAQS